MALFPAAHLWPEQHRTPVLRLIAALALAPAVVAGLLSALAFIVAGMTEPTLAGVLRVTLETSVALSLLSFAFTLTFGLAGVGLLWRLGRRGRPAWALTGGAAGLVAGLLFGAFVPATGHDAVALAFGLAGLTIFLLVRRMAGVRNAPARDASSA